MFMAVLIALTLLFSGEVVVAQLLRPLQKV
jgi:hypothetical protein